MANLFPDTTKTGQWAKRTKVTASSVNTINDSSHERVTATSGTRTLTIEGLGTTGNLNHNASTATLKAALEAITDTSSVTVSGSAGIYSATFADTAANALTGVPSLTGGTNTITIVKGNGGVQSITLGAGNSGGTFTLTFNGQTTAPIAYNATGATIQTALLALSNIGLTVTVNQSSVTGPQNSIVGSPSVTVITNIYDFSNVPNKDVGDMSVNPALLVGGTAVVFNSESFDGLQKRESTAQAFASIGLRRSSNTANNDTEAFNMRKPRDIGDPARIVGEK